MFEVMRIAFFIFGMLLIVGAFIMYAASTTVIGGFEAYTSALIWAYNLLIFGFFVFLLIKILLFFKDSANHRRGNNVRSIQWEKEN